MTDTDAMEFYLSQAGAIMERQALGGAITETDVQQIRFCVRIVDRIGLKCLWRWQKSRSQAHRYSAALGLAEYGRLMRYEGWN